MELLTIKQLAAKAGVPVSRIYKLVADRKLAVRRDSPKARIRIDWADWEAFLRRSLIPAADETPRAGLAGKYPADVIGKFDGRSAYGKH